jgi:hypothetical protein
MGNAKKPGAENAAGKFGWQLGIGALVLMVAIIIGFGMALPRTSCPVQVEIEFST